MKQIFLAIAMVCLLAGVAGAQDSDIIPEATTPNLGLTLPEAYRGSWGEQIRDNFEILDEAYQESSSAPGHTIVDETTSLPARTKLTFKGAGVTCADDLAGDETECTVDIAAAEEDPVVGAINGIVKANGGGTISQAVANTDYETPAAAQTKVDTHVNDASAAHAGTAIGNTPAGNLVATTVQAALNELDTELTAHVLDMTDAHMASNLGNTPAGNLAATTVQAALDELDTEKETPAGAQAKVDTHTGDATDAHAGTAITNTPAGGIAATTVQAALNELDSDLTAHQNDTTAAHAASAISNAPGGNIAATTVQAALNELDSEKQATSTTLTNLISLAAALKVRTCEIIIGDPGTNSPALEDDNDTPVSCANTTGANMTITAVKVYTNAGTPTVRPIITGGASNSILTAAITGSAGTFVTGTLNGTPVQADGTTIDANIVVAGGTAKYIVIRIERTL